MGTKYSLQGVTDPHDQVMRRMLMGDDDVVAPSLVKCTYTFPSHPTEHHRSYWEAAYRPRPLPHLPHLMRTPQQAPTCCVMRRSSRRCRQSTHISLHRRTSPSYACTLLHFTPGSSRSAQRVSEDLMHHPHTMNDMGYGGGCIRTAWMHGDTHGARCIDQVFCAIT